MHLQKKEKLPRENVSRPGSCFLRLFAAAVVLELFLDGKMGGLIGGTGFLQCFFLYTASQWGFQVFQKKTENTEPA